MEGYQDNITEELSQFMMLFVAQTINMCFILYIANLDLTYISFIKYIQDNVPGGKYFFNGWHESFSRFWYLKVGMSILVIKGIGIIWPQILSIIFMVPVCALKRILYGTKQVIQRDMNKCYEKLNTHLWDRYASSLSNICFTMMFSSGIPLLLIFQSLFHLFQYWIDKILSIFLLEIIVIKYSRRPPIYGPELNTLAFKLMPIPIILHMFFAIFTYTSGEIYPYATSDDGSSLFKSVSLLDAMFSKFGIVFLSFCIIMLCLMFLREIIYHALKRLFGGKLSFKWDSQKEFASTFTDVKDTLRYNHIVSYNIMANPEYAYAVEAIKSAIN